jgi:hypothetical protein
MPLAQGGEIDAEPVINCILKCTKPAAGMQGECQKRQVQMSHADLCH